MQDNGPSGDQGIPMPNLSKSLIAKRLSSVGLLPIPCVSGKRAMIKWKDLSVHTLNEQYYKKFDSDKVEGIAVITGAKSGGLECIDIDCKYDLDGNLYDLVMDAIVDANVELYKKLVIASTPSGGYHLIYKSPSPRRNMKLAQRLTTEQELEAENQLIRDSGGQSVVKQHSLVLIETRGEGGYFLGYPSPGYAFVQGGWASVPSLSMEEVDLMIDICRSLDRAKPNKDIPNRSPVGEIPLPPAEDNIIPNRSRSKLQRKYLVTPWDDFNERGDVITLMVQGGWSIVRTIPSPDDGRLVVYLKRPGGKDQSIAATYNHVPSQLYVFSTSTSFPLEKPLKPFEVFMHLQSGGSYVRAIESLESLGYGARKAGIEAPARTGDGLATNISNVERAMLRERDAVRGDRLEIWWDVTLTQSRSGEVKKSIIVAQYRFCKWLGDKGLRCRKQGDNLEWVMLDGIICEYVTKKDITDMVVGFISTLPDRFDFITRDALREAFFKGIDTFLSDIRMAVVPEFEEDDVMRDTAVNAFIPFKNGVLKIDKEGEMLVPYSKFFRYVWKDSIRDFKYSTSEKDNLDRHVFSQFMYNIAGRDMDRYISLLQLMGYSMLRYKDPSFPAAVILCDSKLSDRSEGGTGKGLLVKAMSYLRKVMYEDGKVANKRNQGEFRFSRLTLDTDIVHIADVEKKFDFEAMFSLLTEGIPVNRKFKAEEFIPYEKSPKLILSTNYSISGKGSSHDRRRIEFELADYYNARKTPYTEFGHHFFDEWSDDQWTSFYGVMSRCLRLYLADGVPSFVGINIDMKKFKDDTSSDFVGWFFSQFGNKEEVKVRGPKYSGRVHFATLYNDYLSYAGLERHETRPAKWLYYMHSGCNYVGLEMSEISERKTQYDQYERFLVVNDINKEERIKMIESKLK